MSTANNNLVSADSGRDIRPGYLNLTLSQRDMCMAVELWLNTVIVKEPVNVTSMIESKVGKRSTFEVRAEVLCQTSGEVTNE